MNIKDKNILFAFFMAAGKKYDGYINSICLNKIEIGRTDGKDISNEFIKSIFKETKIKLRREAVKCTNCGKTLDDAKKVQRIEKALMENKVI